MCSPGRVPHTIDRPAVGGPVLDLAVASYGRAAAEHLTERPRAEVAAQKNPSFLGL